jgi:hypothetical protein
MTVRAAELLMGIITLVVSISIMLKSAELSVGWVEGRGPGSGMWPFWLSLGMALASVATIIRWFMGVTPESRSTEAYIERDTVFLVLITMLGLLALLLLTEYTGTYVAVMLFMLFYIKVIGRHDWKSTLPFVFGTPIFIYLLFEVALTKYLPKGLPIFEEAFLVIDDIRYTYFY